ncbi:MAG: aspartate/glutamate racemase family protein [Spirochaetia bacterium]|nr:aspartate/glutamate racemase family protein [Spirochaetia bacterium]
MKVNSNSLDSKIIVIAGGVGPAAGVDLHRLIIENTPLVYKDQDHLRVIHLSLSDLIPDRTESLKTHTPHIPALNMASLIESIIPTCHYYHTHAVVGIPCNTFHAEPIFSKFLEAMAPFKETISVINMIEETINHLSQIVEHNESIGIMSTTGTRTFRLYDNPLEKRGYKVIHPADQEKIHSSIYHPDWGIKAVSGESQENKLILIDALEELYQKGVKAIILGCTEIPLVLKATQYKGIPLVNPVVLLASALIKGAGRETLPFIKE